jgi:hypothetical protein
MAEVENVTVEVEVKVNDPTGVLYLMGQHVRNHRELLATVAVVVVAEIVLGVWLALLTVGVVG